MTFKKTKIGFSIQENGSIKAQATLLCLKQEFNGKLIRQPYLTDVASFQKGCGTILMNSIIDFFKSKISNRSGYNSDKIWLEVNPNNLRAIRLYEKVGFKFTNWSEDLVENYLLRMENK
jgi:hypothetical protein